MSERTRRDVLRDGAAVGAAAMLASYGLPADGADAHRRRPRRRRKRRVAVLGGGVAGLTVAHELAERGFDVTVYERRAWGGKARSFGVRGTASGGRRPLPGEHGARFIPGLYANLPDTLRRIPFPGQADGVYGNLVTADQGTYARAGREELNVSWTLAEPRPWTFEQFRQTLVAALQTSTRLPAHEIAYFVDRLLVFFASSDARRLGQWEGTSWWDFVAAERFSEDYRRLLVSSVTRFILGSKADEASTRTLGLLWQAGIYNVMGRGSEGDFDRVLDLPTNEAWIAPWLRHLRSLGVRLRRGYQVERLRMRGGRVAGARVRRGGRCFEIEADWFVLAVPVERARPLLGRAALRVDPSLESLRELETRWMNGIQFFTRRPVPIVRGHVFYVDSPWALTSISQAQFWKDRDFRRDYGDGSARDCISVDIGAFDEPGIVYGRPARDLRPRQVAREVWAQMKAHLNEGGRTVLGEDQVVAWKLDPGLRYRRGRSRPRNEDPLFISTPGAWANRPDARTAIPNLFLAADYVKAHIDTASMEGASDAARRAANAVLDAADSPRAHAPVHRLYQPPEWEPLRAADEEAYRRGLPHPLDAPAPGPGLPDLPLLRRE